MGLARSSLAVAVGAAALTLTPGPTGDASARKFQMSGSWEMRRGGVFLPLQFATSPNPGTGGPPPVMSFPNGPVLGVGGVSATGSAPATLRVPRHRFGEEFTAKIPIGPRPLVQITTGLTPDGPATTAELAPGSGPGSFTWCPGDPGCVVGDGMLSTDPPQGAGPRNGRVIYRAGPNQFGGVMRMLIQGAGSVSSRINLSPFQAAHVRFGPVAGADGGIQHTGGPYAVTVMDTQTLGIATQPLVPPTSTGLITAPGPIVSWVPTQCAGTGGPPPSACISYSTHTGFPFTTGTVFVQQTTGPTQDAFFTVMGSDMRTALGAGNITLVAGGLTLRRTVGFSDRDYASFGRVRMTLSAPIPSLSPAGFAAATALVLLAAGYALRRRG